MSSEIGSPPPYFPASTPKGAAVPNFADRGEFWTMTSAASVCSSPSFVSMMSLYRSALHAARSIGPNHWP